MLAAVIMVAVIALAGSGYDLMSVRAQKSNLQTLSDNAALYAVRELALATADEEYISALAISFVESGMAPGIISILPEVDTEAQQVIVTVTAKPRTNFPGPLSSMESIKVSSTAQLSGGGGNICMIGLSPVAMSTVRIRSKAQITAESCAIYSNSDSTSSMTVSNTATVTAEFICVAGGYRGKKDGLMSPPVEDCLPIEDPLENRMAPPVDKCDFTDTVVTGFEKLSPGVYCGGLEINGGTATLARGIYVMRGGSLIVTGGGTLEGDYVGFYLADDVSKIGFDFEATVDISAPRDGIMAGMLIMSVPYAPTIPNPMLTQKLPLVGNTSTNVIDTVSNATRLGDGVGPADHTIRSDNARRMVGTIYLPNGKLVIDGSDPIADQSEYTVIVADAFELQDGPNLVLRTDYGLTDIPVPDGVGPGRDSFPVLVD